MKLTRRGILATVTGLSFFAAVGCSNQSGGAGSDTAANAPASTNASSEEVNVYSSRHYDTDEQLYDKFTQETGIEVNVIEGDADELIERIKNEGQNSPADVFITVDAGRLWRAEEAGVLQPVSSKTLEERIPANLREPEGHWFGLTKRARVIAYNKNEVQPSELSTYEDLADPKWQGRVCIRSSNNIYNQSLVASMVETMGPEQTEAWLQGLVNNLAREPEGGDTDQIKAVAAGQCDVAIVNHYYWARMAKSEDAADRQITDQVGLFFPNQNDRGTHVNISGIGVVADAPNPDNAIAFIEFLTSPEAQAIFADGNNEYPVVADAKSSSTVMDLGDFKEDSVNVSTYGENNPEVVKLVDQAGWK